MIKELEEKVNSRLTLNSVVDKVDIKPGFIYYTQVRIY